ncbi:uncharacterized protein LOC103849412 [Brassica rapa]|uniref:uncharacterized protein LOC103849412 n=1 Tax=Brassica campestris TaxID=3711 RepID=UPI00142D79B6|nr:uncharacterized protein LOC103849412 [Brassica rapa]
MINQMVVTFVLGILIIPAIVINGEFSDTHDAKIDLLLKKLNKPAVKSIKSPYGGIIDCVHMKNHPIYDHPLFKNHTIQMKPSGDHDKWNNDTLNIDDESIVTQLWTINGKCPQNTIPIRRTTREDILRAESIENYGKKYPNNIPRRKPANSTNEIHEYATLRVNGIFRGAEAVINVWKPYVQMPREFSLAQMWLEAGPPSNLNTIEFGWQVYPGRYGDDNARFFVYWTADGYRSGCYNLDCPGFVPVNQAYVLGEPIGHVSTLGGQQYEIPTTIWKDPRTGNWWLKLNHHVFIGYWPSILFNHLRNGATDITWGGEITNYRVNLQHTMTNMGSGGFASEGYERASYFRKLKIYDECNTWKPIHDRVPEYFITQESCYNIRYAYETDWGDYFFYGGPGRNLYCT